PTLFILALCYSIYSIVLAVISMVYIRSYCIMCIASYAVNLTLLFYTWLIHKRFENISMMEGIQKDFRWLIDRKNATCVYLCMVGGTAFLLTLFTPHYWEISSLPLSLELSRGITKEGHPWIGAEDPKIIIAEFSDYQCFQCKKMHFYLRDFMATHPGKLRLVHRNFPMDHAYNFIVKEPYHIGAGKMALLSLYAAKKQKFWEINDFLFNIDKQKGYFNIREMAKLVGFDVIEFAGSVNDPTLQYKLKTDIRDAIRLGITGTPGYLIDGRLYIGHIPADIINAIID
ncbi:thioredoxin domain-containing protein, partial [Thermodesulfobacteriota bacterium]